MVRSGRRRPTAREFGIGGILLAVAAGLWAWFLGASSQAYHEHVRLQAAELRLRLVQDAVDDARMNGLMGEQLVQLGLKGLAAECGEHLGHAARVPDEGDLRRCLLDDLAATEVPGTWSVEHGIYLVRIEEVPALGLGVASGPHGVPWIAYAWPARRAGPADIRAKGPRDLARGVERTIAVASDGSVRWTSSARYTGLAAAPAPDAALAPERADDAPPALAVGPGRDGETWSDEDLFGIFDRELDACRQRDDARAAAAAPPPPPETAPERRAREDLLEIATSWRRWGARPEMLASWRPALALHDCDEDRDLLGVDVLARFGHGDYEFRVEACPAEPAFRSVADGPRLDWVAYAWPAHTNGRTWVVTSDGALAWTNDWRHVAQVRGPDLGASFSEARSKGRVLAGTWHASDGNVWRRPAAEAPR